MTDTQTTPGSKRPPLVDEVRQALTRIPNRMWFGMLLLVWLALFHFLGNSTLGYLDTRSLFRWMIYAYETNPDDQLGYLVPFIVLGLIWWKRSQLLASETRLWWPALVLVIIGLVLHVLGFLVQQTRISVIGFFAGLYGLAGVTWGPKLLANIFFPFFLFAFCVPLGNSAEIITFPLRQFATYISVATAHHVLGIDVIQQGTMLWAPSGKYRYEIAAACSGIRSLTAFLLLTIIVAFVYLKSSWRRILMVAMAFPLAILSNVIRLLCIIIAAEAFGQATGMRLHDSALFSPLPYIPSLIAVVVLSKWLEEKPKTGVESTIPAMPEPSSTVPIHNPSFARSRESWVLFAATCLLIGMASGFLVYARSNHHLGKPGVRVVPEIIYGQEDQDTGTNGLFVAGTHRAFLPERVLDYTATNLPIARSVYEWLPKDTVYGRCLYTAPDGVSLLNSIVLMGTDRTSIHQPQYCLPAQGFWITKSELDTIRIPRPHPYDLPVMKVTAKSTVRLPNDQPNPLRAVFVYWFVADQRLTADHSQRMWWMSRDLILHGILQRWAYSSVLGVCNEGGEEALYDRMKHFITASVPEYQLTVGSPVK